MAQQTMPVQQPIHFMQMWLLQTRVTRASISLLVPTTLLVGVLTFVNRWSSVAFIALGITWLTIFVAICMNAIYKRIDARALQIRKTVDDAAYSELIDDVERYLRETD